MVVVRAYFVIKFDANGGSDAPSAVYGTGIIGSDQQSVEISATLPTAKPTKKYHRFIGWAFYPDRTVPTFPAGMPAAVTATATRENTTVTWTLYAVYVPNKVTITFNANGGSGGPTTLSVDQGVASQIPYSVPTRANYNFTGWRYTLSDGTTKTCRAGATVILTEDATFIAIWDKKGSDFDSIPSAVQMDGTTQATMTFATTSFSDHHTVRIVLGNRSQEHTNVGSSLTFTIPIAWNNALPSTTSWEATVYLTTYDSSNNQIDEIKETKMSLAVPASIVPSATVATSVSGNALTVQWNKYVQGYSSVSFAINASGTYSAKIKSVEINGADYSYSGTYDAASISVTLTSGVIKLSGDVKFIIKVTDSRGRVSSFARTAHFEQYYKPTFNKLLVYRSDGQGNEDEFEGAYITTKVTGVKVACAGNNTYTINWIKQKVYRAASYTTVQSNAQINTNYYFTADTSKTYVVNVRVTDAFGEYYEEERTIQSVVGSLSLGLNNDRARFGGAVRQQGLEVDWYSRFHNDVVIDGRLYAAGSMQAGSIAVRSVSAGNVVTVAVTFPTAFAQAPTVVACLYSSQTAGLGDCSVSVWDLTTAGFSLRLENNYSSSRDIGATWIAML